MNPEYMRKVIAMILLFSPGAVRSKKPLGQRVSNRPKLIYETIKILVLKHVI